MGGASSVLAEPQVPWKASVKVVFRLQPVTVPVPLAFNVCPSALKVIVAAVKVGVMEQLTPV